MASRAPHREELMSALEAEAEAQRLAMNGAQEDSHRVFLQAVEHYRRSWELASATSYGRLVGMLKAAILAGDAGAAARYVRTALDPEPEASATAAYALALAALVEDDDVDAGRRTAAMRGASEAFERTADAIDALAARDDAGYAEALGAIVRDFEQRPEHLTGVPIADTALVLERLAARRGMSSGVTSPLLPLP